jgi:hypothetical protein
MNRRQRARNAKESMSALTKGREYRSLMTRSLQQRWRWRIIGELQRRDPPGVAPRDDAKWRGHEVKAVNRKISK